jgi:hypothetical protein
MKYLPLFVVSFKILSLGKIAVFELDLRDCREVRGGISRGGVGLIRGILYLQA